MDDTTKLIVGLGAATVGYIIYDKFIRNAGDYPKTLSRAGINIEVYNVADEAEVSDFLGIYPPGPEPLSYLATLDSQGLAEWRAYWYQHFTFNVHRADLFPIIEELYAAAGGE